VLHEVKQGIAMEEIAVETMKGEIDNLKFTIKKQIPWPLVRERTIPTDRPPLVDEI
jgi:hypothetical protein